MRAEDAAGRAAGGAAGGTAGGGEVVFLDGERLRPGSPALGVGSPGFAYAICVFEGIAAYCAGPQAPILVFRLKDHLDRLFASMAAVGLDPPWSREALAREIERCLRAAGLACDGHVRVMAWPDGPTEIGTDGPVRMAIVVRPLPGGRGPLARPARLAITAVARPDDAALPARVKATANYLVARRALMATRPLGAEPILVNAAGRLAEGATANLFLVRRGRLLTPSLDESVLAGITRDTVIRLAAARGIATEERGIAPAEALEADEAFLTGSLCEVRPVETIDGRRPGGTSEGSLAALIAADYARSVRSPSPWVREIGRDGPGAE